MVPALVDTYPDSFIVLMGGGAVDAAEIEALKYMQWLHIQEPVEVAVRREVFWGASLVIMTAVGPPGHAIMTLDALEASACGANTLILSSGGRTHLQDDPALAEDVKEDLESAARRDRTMEKDENWAATYRGLPLIQRNYGDVNQPDWEAAELWLLDWQGWAPAGAALVQSIGVF